MQSSHSRMIPAAARKFDIAFDESTCSISQMNPDTNFHSDGVRDARERVSTNISLLWSERRVAKRFLQTFHS